MKYNLDLLIDKTQEDNRLKYLFFWGHQPAPDGSINKSCFSQWWEAPFMVDDNIYSTAEHWMMAQKALLFHDHEAHGLIMGAKSAAEAKKLGRGIKNFEDATWVKWRSEIVLYGSIHKFKQHPSFLEFILNTKDRILVEASPVDTIWGNGLPADNPKSNNPAEWRGLNLLGFALMEARDILRDNGALPDLNF